MLLHYLILIIAQEYLVSKIIRLLRIVKTAQVLYEKATHGFSVFFNEITMCTAEFNGRVR